MYRDLPGVKIFVLKYTKKILNILYTENCHMNFDVVASITATASISACSLDRTSLTF